MSAVKPSLDPTQGWFILRDGYVQTKVSRNLPLFQAAISASLGHGYPDPQMSFLQYVVIQGSFLTVYDNQEGLQ